MSTLPESAWEAIFAEHERDHQHADASRLGCNGCAMLAYAESLRGQLQTLRGEHERLKEPRYGALSPTLADQLATLTQEKAALEARERALREALEKTGLSYHHEKHRLGYSGPAYSFEVCTSPVCVGARAALAPRPRHE